MNRSDLTHRQQIFIDDAFVVRWITIIHLLQALADDLTSKNEKIRELQDALKQCSADNAVQDVTPTHSPSTFKVSYNGVRSHSYFIFLQVDNALAFVLTTGEPW